MDNFRVGAGTEDPHLEGRAAPEFVLDGHQSHVSIDLIILSFCWTHCVFFKLSVAFTFVKGSRSPGVPI